MEKSTNTRGNPWHDSRGRFCSGFSKEEVNGNTHYNGADDTTYEFYGDFDIGRIEPIENGNEYIDKPYGGIWLSPTNSDWKWSDWCKAEQFAECSEDKRHEIRLNGARILHIRGKEDLQKLGLTKENHNYYGVDFVELSKQYDAIHYHFTTAGQALYGWDCDSIVVLNKSVLMVGGEENAEIE